MTISHKRKLLFIHIPKNAGTSVYSYFNSPVESILPDQTWEKYSSFFREYWDEYTKFSIVRNPFDRFKSIYKMFLYGNNINDFAEYVYMGNEHILTRPQNHYIFDDNILMVDQIIRYENLEEDFKKLNIFNFPHKNKSPYIEEEKVFLNNTSKDIIREIYKKDFELLNYDKS